MSSIMANSSEASPRSSKQYSDFSPRSSKQSGQQEKFSRMDTKGYESSILSGEYSARPPPKRRLLPPIFTARADASNDSPCTPRPLRVYRRPSVDSALSSNGSRLVGLRQSSKASDNDSLKSPRSVCSGSSFRTQSTYATQVDEKVGQNELELAHLIARQLKISDSDMAPTVRLIALYPQAFARERIAVMRKMTREQIQERRSWGSRRCSFDSTREDSDDLFDDFEFDRQHSY